MKEDSNLKKGKFGKYPILIIGALASSSLLLEPVFFPSKTNVPELEQRVGDISFLDAKNNSRLRQDYIDQIVDEYGLVEGLRDITYSPELIGLHKVDSTFAVMRTTYPEVPPGYEGYDLETNILAYRGSFIYPQSENEFLSLLMDHEYRHTDQIRGRMKLIFFSKQEYNSLASEISERLFDINGDLYGLVHELDAYSTQIDSFYKRDLSEKFKMDMVSFYNFHVNLLNQKSETPFVRYLREKFRKK
tara:strand:- start:66 stop:803 length:738 start_codon:yes stop_codon:yes gene_type:complete